MGRFLSIPASLVLLASSSVAVADGLPSGEGSVLPPDEQAAISQAKGMSKAFRAVARLAAPSVVSIETTPDVPKARGRGMRLPPGMQGIPGVPNVPGLQMFPMAPGTQAVPQGMGTGFIVSDDGHIVTNNHVVRMGGSVKVHLNDGREAAATVVGTDPETDIAVLKVELDGLKAIEFGDSDAAEPGDWVVALGAPFGLKDTVTAGIISAKGREVGLSPLESYLQTDATINPGNSGGPLVDLDGKVVGINTAIESRSGGSDGIGFAIPSNMAKGVVESIIGGGSPSRGYLGIQMQPLDQALAANFGFGGRGVLVNQVLPGSPAERAGLEPGDILVKVNCQEVPSMQRVQRAIKLCAPGAECPIELFRDGEVQVVTATLEDTATQLAAAGGGRALPRAAGVRQAPSVLDLGSLGVEVGELTDATAKERGLSDARGVLVTAVTEGSAAERAGLREGDIIRQVAGTRVADVAAWESTMRSAMGPGRSVRILAERDGNARFFLLRS
jgi:serine protease Do